MQPELFRPRLTYPDLPYGSMLDRPVFLYPEHEALVSRDASLTFREVEGLVNACANGLRALGIGRGDRACLFMTNRPEYVVSLYALARLGAVASPMNPSYREREVAYQLTDAGAVGVIVQHDLLPVVEAARREAPHLKHVVTVGGPPAPGTVAFRDLVAGSPAIRPPDPGVGPDDLLVLPYSSGTTGLPKGVRLSHANFVRNNIQFVAALRVTAADRLLVFLPFYHIYGLMLLGGAVHTGARLVIMERFDLGECCRLVEAQRITLFFAVPPVLAALTGAPETTRVDWGSVRLCMIGAAPVPPEVCRRFTALTGVKTLQGYGLTEAGPVTHLNAAHDDRLNVLDSAGLAVHDVAHRVVDVETGTRSLAPGESGEIVVRSPGVMQGYWNAPEATAAALRDGWLHTGDIGTIDAHGHVRVTDRKKEMIKVKGFGVAPAEIEALFFEHPAVADVGVVGTPDPVAGEIPKAFVVVKPGRAVTAEALIAFARERLAGYKVPGEVEFVDAIPRTASGKILRRVLRDRERRA
jgi:long-chain acyl-CoA synthetase